MPVARTPAKPPQPSETPVSGRACRGGRNHAGTAGRGRDSLRLALAAIMAGGAALRVWIATLNAGLTMDSPLYVSMAESIGRGERAAGPAHHGYPLLITLAHLVLPGREWPGRAVSFIAGIAVIPLVYLLARRIAPPWAACLAAALAALHPLLTVYSGPIMTETTFLAIVLASLLAIERRSPLVGGLGLGLGYVVRPEAVVVALGVVVLLRRGWRAALALALGFTLVAGAYVGYLSWERGGFTLTPKEALVRPGFDSRAEAEWRVSETTQAPSEPHSFGERVRWAAPGVAARYVPRLVRHLARLIASWPWPLLVLSAVGLALRPGPAAAPLLQVLVLPLLAVGANIRFTILFLPTLAIYAAAGAAWCLERSKVPPKIGAAAVVILAVAGLTWAWSGGAGRSARVFDDGPMMQIREAGSWLREHGRPGAAVMDRKAYVPFYAGMRHLQLPDDDYETILRYVVSSGADYLVLEEFVVETLRPQLLPLIADAGFRTRETRLRVVHLVRDGPHTGVAILEVVR